MIKYKSLKHTKKVQQVSKPQILYLDQPALKVYQKENHKMNKKIIEFQTLKLKKSVINSTDQANLFYQL
jgi:hypothetical protein